MTQRVRRHDKRIIYLLAAVFVATFSFAFLNGRFGNTEEDAEAASLANFDAGNIISDYVMGNFNSMSESDIQNFLTSKNSCSNTDYDYYRALSNGSSYEWHWKDGHFVCLSEEKFGDGEVIGSGETAAHIIYQAAQDYKINPQVLIVLLQKETGLITDPIPNNGDYRKATGYGCPDTAACSSKYYGFKNQVRHAAALFRDVLDGGWTNYPLGNTYIQYNPNSSCGGSTVNIQNLATSALYRYTPYQPNAGALEAGYGTAYCGSYGNRNFYLYFNDWFGNSMSNGFIKLDTPRYFEITEDQPRINPYTEEESEQSKLLIGQQIKFTTKIKLMDGTWCFRTQHNTQYNIVACLPQKYLKEISLAYEDLNNSEQEKMILYDSDKFYIRAEAEVQHLPHSIKRKFTQKTTMHGQVYYITEYDASHTSSEYGISEEDIVSFEAIDEYYKIANTNKINIETMNNGSSVQESTTRHFTKKIFWKNKWYYQTEYDDLEDTVYVIDADKLSDPYVYIDFQNPREMTLIQDVDRKDPITNELYDTIHANTTLRFTTKIYINGEWYYRTEHNTEHNINATVPASAVREVNY